MSNNRTSLQTWALLAAISGLTSVLFYFGAAFLPVPDFVALSFAFFFGPLLSISFIGIYRFMAETNDGPVLQIACLLGIIAGVMVTIMLVVQVGNNMVRSEMLGSATTDAAKDAALLAWRAVNRVQYLVDVVWDIFICGATMMLGIAMLSHQRFGKLWGSLGIASGFLLLFLNLRSFPYAPSETGSVDLGPLVAIWMLAVFIRMLFMKHQESN